MTASAMASTHGTMVDKRDGKKYKTVKIGNQTWMAENLNYKTQDSFCYKDDESNCKKYGRLYKWDAAKEACPSGWHLPSKEEFETLFESVGGIQVAGEKLRSREGWKGGGGTDAFGFSALPAGEKTDVTHNAIGDGALFWSSTEIDSNFAHSMGLFFYYDNAESAGYNKNYSFSVRCLKGDGGLAESTIDRSKNVDDEKSSAGALVDNRDGKEYRTVKIGNQTWMAENLNYETQDSYCYEDDESNCSKYGRLYKWNVAKKACPDSWHLPSKAEFETLFSSVGGKQVAGKHLKSNSGWDEGNGTDDFGFTALHAGHRNGSGYYGKEDASFWSFTEGNSDLASGMLLRYDNDNADMYYYNKHSAFSVRCLQD